MIQGSEEWFQARCGKVTASRVSDVISKTKSGWGASRANYMAELIAERLTGVPATSYTNQAMQWGIDTEPQARDAYAFYTDFQVEEVGFVVHPEIEASGASPDGLISDIGLVEIKCPNTATHIDTLLGQKIPDKYLTQMMWQMVCTERKWCDFVSFDPRMPERLRLFVTRFHYNEATAETLTEAVKQFLGELDEKLEKLGGL